MTSPSSKTWYAMPPEAVFGALQTSHDGLSQAEAAKRQARDGRNLLPRPKGKAAWFRFLLQFHQPLVYMLLFAALVAGLLREWVDASVILGVTLVNALIGFLQENKALAALAALAKMMGNSALVLRDGKRLSLPAEELVVGDIVFLQAGDKVPADLRLLESKDLRIAEATLTGESMPSEKQTAALGGSVGLADISCMAFASTLVVTGQGKGVVVSIAEATEIGVISKLLSSTEELETPLTREISRFSRWLMFVILGLAGLAIAVGLWRGMSLLKAWMAAVALAVGAIPEGLPAAVTITLALGVSRMARRRAILRKLPAVETLGSTTIICSDKTGTLTQGQMTVRSLQMHETTFSLSGLGYRPEGELTLDGKPIDPALYPGLSELLTAGLLCNDASLSWDAEASLWTIQGDPTEGALLVSARKAKLDASALHTRFPRLDLLPFDSEKQYMATLHPSGISASVASSDAPSSSKSSKTSEPSSATKGKQKIVVKGAVEKILPLCCDVLTATGERRSLENRDILSSVEALAKEGMRVLAFATKERPPREDLTEGDLAEGLTFLGLQAMQDPPRAEVIDAVRDCLSAGIEIKMITGDHLTTAKAIAAQIGLKADPTAIQAIAGRELALASPGEIATAAKNCTVFARVSPAQKLLLVESLQAQGQIVAMTGDGVNDAPALKRADIGIAMGITGTEVSKEAAALVLTDDNFATIRDAVEEGRGVFDNITKFIVWTLPTNLGEGFVLLAAILAGVTLPGQPNEIALPITPLQILWINMTTAVLLGLPLAFEPKEGDVMKRLPRPPTTSFLTSELIERIFLVGFLLLLGAFTLFFWELHRGGSLQRAQTIAVNVFVIVQAFYLLNCRALRSSLLSIGFFSNPIVWLGIGLTLGLQALLTYAPFMQRLFHTAPLTFLDWLWIVAYGFFAFLVVGLAKYLRHPPTRL